MFENRLRFDKVTDSLQVGTFLRGSRLEARGVEAKDVLPNTNRTQAAERAGKCRFLSLDLDLDL